MIVYIKFCFYESVRPKGSAIKKKPGKYFEKNHGKSPNPGKFGTKIRESQEKLQGFSV
jgi:hypothetical protein